MLFWASKKNVEGEIKYLGKFLSSEKTSLERCFCNYPLWNLEGISSKNVIAGFEVTRIYPLNKFKYPEKCLNSNLVKKYQTRIENGCKEEMADILGDKVSNASTNTQSNPLTPSKYPTSSINKTPSFGYFFFIARLQIVLSLWFENAWKMFMPIFHVFIAVSPIEVK